MLLEINIDDNLFLLMNVYNANNESDQVKTLTDFSDFGGDFSVIFYSFLEAQGEGDLV